MKTSTTLFIVLLLGCAGTIYANVINQGTTVTIVGGTTVTNIGNFNNQSGSIVNSGTLEIVDGIFTNTGNPTVGGLVKIRGTNCALAGTTTFNDVELNTTNTTEVLPGLSTFGNNLFVKAGNLGFVGGSIDYGVNANLVYNGTTLTTTGAEFPFHLATFNPKTVRVTNAAGVTMQSDGQVLYTLILEQGTLTSNGKLFMASTALQTGIVDDFTGAYTGTIAGSMTVDRYVTNPPAPAQPPGVYFHYVGTPLVGGTAAGWGDDFSIATINTMTNGAPVIPHADCRTSSLMNGSPYGGIFTYDESLVTFCQFQGWRVRTGAEPATRGKGFAAIIGSSSLIDQTGTYANADVSLTLSSLGTDPNWKAFHLVSNPFCAPMDWDVNYAQIGGNASDIDGDAYVYDPNTGNYVVFNNINQGFIGTSQAFFVRGKPTLRSSPATSFNVTLDKDSRVNTNNNTFYRIGQPYEFALGINITSPTNTKDNTLIAFDPSFNDSFDNGYDANKLNSDAGVPSLYTEAMNGDRLAIHAIPVNTGLIVIPLSLKTEGTGSFTMVFDQVNTFPSTMMITLEDLQTGIFQDIRTNPQYVFSATATDAEGRFLLHFTPQLIVHTEEANCSGNNGYITLDQEGGVIWDYTLVDDQGDAVASAVGFTAFDTIRGLAPGHYTIQLNHSSGYHTTEEVIVHGLPVVAALMVPSATSVNQNEPIDFSIAGNATQYTCDMGDGNVLTNVSNGFQYHYPLPGTYTVTLRGTNGVCSDEMTVNIKVTQRFMVPDNFPELTAPVESPPATTSIGESIERNLTVYHYDGKLYIKQTVLKGDNRLNVRLFNTLGQEVQFISGNLPYNQYQEYPLNSLAAGPYLVKAQVADVTVTKKIVFVR